jgi:leader peptidase (prepilin peptidase)/N-methyltransferase
MLLLVVSCAFGALLFGAAGWLGTLLADAFYGAIVRESDGPPARAVPVSVFVAAPACIGAVVALQDAPPARMALLVMAVLALSAGAATDMRAGIIPDLFTLGPLVITLAVAVLQRDGGPLWGMLLAFVPFALLAVFSRGRGMGWGDVKLAALGGALIGMAGITLAVALASVAAYVASLVNRRPRQPIAFGPYLAAAIVAAFALGTPR